MEENVIASLDYQSKLEFRVIVTQGKYIPQEDQLSASIYRYSMTNDSGEEDITSNNTSILDEAEYSKHCKRVGALIKKQMLATNQTYFQLVQTNTGKTLEIVLENIQTVSVEAIQEKIAEIEGLAPDCVFLDRNSIGGHPDPSSLAQ